MEREREQSELRGSMEEAEPRIRSFRLEGYNNRRAFLRSYPLQWEGTDDEDGDEGDDSGARVQVERGSDRLGGTAKRGSKGDKFSCFNQRIVVAAILWGGRRMLLLKKLKKKVGFCLSACQPLCFSCKPKANHLAAA